MPVLIVSANGSITERSTLEAAVMDHATQPDPHLINVFKQIIIVTTDMAQVATVVTIPSTVEVRFANGAVYTVGSGKTLDLRACEFQRPHYDCFLLNGGTVLVPKAGPVIQDWSIKNLIASGIATIAGALTAASAAFTGACSAAGGFTGNVTGNLTGNVTGNLIGVASNARDADPSKTGNIPATGVAGLLIQQGITSGVTGTVPFPIAFKAATTPIVVCQTYMAGFVPIVELTAVSPTAFSFHNYVTSSGQDINTTVSWIAIGERA